MPNPTSGQTAYEAYWQVHRHDGHYHAPPPFAKLPEITRASWEAAAAAVRALIPPANEPSQPGGRCTGTAATSDSAGSIPPAGAEG